MATYFLSGSRSDRKPGWLRRSVAALTAAALSLTLAMPAHAQGRVAVVRDAEIETLLRDYANPIFKAAGLMTSRVQIVLVNDPSFNAFVDGQTDVHQHRGAGRFNGSERDHRRDRP
jgi:predicted Zn-dependent protease